MLNFNQKGIASIFLILILLIGLVGGVYLVQNPKIFQSKAYESGYINFIDDFRKTFPNNITTNIFVHLEIKPPAWQNETTDPDQYEFPALARVSLDQTKMNPESNCEITGEPLTNCEEIILEKPTDKIYLSWVLPKKEGTYQIYTRFYSDKHNAKDLSAPIIFKDSEEVGFEVPAIFVGIQSFITAIFDAFKKIPATSAINATSIFISHVYTAGEQVVTLSQAQQLGFNVDFTVAESGEIKFLYDPDQLSKLSISLEFFPERDTITNEPRLVILSKPNPTDQQDSLQASMEIALGETGGRIVGSLINRGITKISEIETIKTITSKFRIPKEGNTPPAAIGTGKRIAAGGIRRIAGLSVKNIARMNAYEQNHFKAIWPLLQTGEAYVMDPRISRPTMDKLLTGVENAYGRVGLPKLNRSDIMSTVDNNWVIVIPANRMSMFGFTTPPAAFAANRLVVVNNEEFADVEATLAHEFVHVISSNTRRYGEKKIAPQGVYFIYNQDQSDVYGATMSQIYELFTEEVVRVFFNGENAYQRKYPQLFRSLTDFVNVLIKTSDNKLTYADFSLFALTGNDKILMKTMIDNGVTPARFMQILNKSFDAQKLARITQDYYKAREKSTLIKAGAVAGGSAVFMGTVFAATARGEELPNDITIIYEAPNQDVNLSTINTKDSEGNSTPPESAKCPSPYPQCAGTTGLESMTKGHAYLVTPVCDNSGSIIDYKKEDRGESQDCGEKEPTPATTTTTCKPPYSQCAGTTGLENYTQGHTILVTPICDSSGNIASYNTEDLGNKGECQ